MPKASAASCNLVTKDRWQGNRKYPKVRTGVENPCQLWLGVHAQLGNPRCVDFHGGDRAEDSEMPGEASGDAVVVKLPLPSGDAGAAASSESASSRLS